LQQHACDTRLTIGNDLKQNHLIRRQQFSLEAHSIFLDYSRQRINSLTIEYLIALAEEFQVREKAVALMQGDKINVSENRAALHTALRTIEYKPVWVDGYDIMHDVMNTREQIKIIATHIRSGKWLGHTGKPIKDIVNIGMGGSDLGPRLCIRALADFSSAELGYHFISDVDPESFKKAVRFLDPQSTLFVISSKSFTTKETLLNAKKAREWFGMEHYPEQHFIAVTANPVRASQMGIKTILPIWDWVGGRYSLCSAVNLITAIAIGYERFIELLLGASNMDNHFLHTEFAENLPVLMAMLGIWNTNFLNIDNLLLLAYSQKLEYFIPYVQQLDMESNGKSIDMAGRAVNYATGPIVWGGLGNQAQHSYLQLLCQGTHQVSADFITLKSHDNYVINEMCDYQLNVLSEGVDCIGQSHGFIAGNLPINHIKLADCTPFTLGAFVALYEHKIFVQSIIWNINPFDQPGVESAKRVGGLSEAVS